MVSSFSFSTICIYQLDHLSPKLSLFESASRLSLAEEIQLRCWSLDQAFPLGNSKLHSTESKNLNRLVKKYLAMIQCNYGICLTTWWKLPHRPPPEVKSRPNRTKAVFKLWSMRNFWCDDDVQDWICQWLWYQLKYDVYRLLLYPSAESNPSIEELSSCSTSWLIYMSLSACERNSSIKRSSSCCHPASGEGRSSKMGYEETEYEWPRGSTVVFSGLGVRATLSQKDKVTPTKPKVLKE